MYMSERTPAQRTFDKKFASPTEEVDFLRERVAEKERALLDRNLEADEADYETLAREELKEYNEFTPESVLHKRHQMRGHEFTSTVEGVKTSTIRLRML